MKGCKVVWNMIVSGVNIVMKRGLRMYVLLSGVKEELKRE